MCCNKDLPSLFNDANTHLSYVCSWFKANRFSLNLKKCYYMIVCNRNKKCAVHNLNISISNQHIAKVDFIKFLDVFIDSHLPWKPHINETCKKSIQINWNYFPAQTCFSWQGLTYTLLLTYLYDLICLTVILFGWILLPVTWKFYRKKVIRTIAKCHFRAHTTPLFKQFSLLRIQEINYYQQNIFMYKYSTKQLPPPLASVFKVNCNFRNYQTRSSFFVHLPKHRTSAFQHSIMWSGPCN